MTIGLLSRSATNQIEYICTCLNIKSLESKTSSNVFPESVLGHYLIKSTSKPKDLHFTSKSNNIKTKAIEAEETYSNAMRRAFDQPNHALPYHLNRDTYSKLINDNLDADVILNQFATASPEGLHFLCYLLVQQCSSFKKLLKGIGEVGRLVDMELAVEKLFGVVMEVSKAKYGSIHIFENGIVATKCTNWQQREGPISIPNSILEGEVINCGSLTRNNGDDDEPTCSLIAPIYGVGNIVIGMIELFDKLNGNPVFTFDEEFGVKELGNLASILFNQINIIQDSQRKRECLNDFFKLSATVKGSAWIDTISKTALSLVESDSCLTSLDDAGNSRTYLKELSDTVKLTKRTTSKRQELSPFHFVLIAPCIDFNSGYCFGTIQLVRPSKEFSETDESQITSLCGLVSSTHYCNQILVKLQAELDNEKALNEQSSAILKAIDSCMIIVSESGIALQILNGILISISEDLESKMRGESFTTWWEAENEELVDDIRRTRKDGITCRGWMVDFFGRGFDGDRNCFKVNYEVLRMGSGRIRRDKFMAVIVVITRVTNNQLMIEQLSTQLPKSDLNDIITGKSHNQMNLKMVACLSIKVPNLVFKGLTQSKVNFLLSQYSQIVSDSAFEFNGIAMTNVLGILTEVQGFKATIVFGIPLLSSSDLTRCIDCSFKIRKLIDTFNTKSLEDGLPEIDISIGIATGDSLCGIFNY